VGTQKRERQKANRAKKQAVLARQERTETVKRNVVRWVIVAVAALGGVLLIAWIGGAFDGDDDSPQIDTPITLPVESTPTSVAATSVPATTTAP
jgi:hypothetical protein